MSFPVWSGSMIMSRARPVIRSTSQTATRPPSAPGTSRWETTPLIVPAIMLRACACWCGGKKSSSLLIDSIASTVWTVESTRWPVSAADSAVWTVSSSRISPIRITSGSWRSTRRSARLKDTVSIPTSRWLIAESLSLCTNSIGSSIVTMCFVVVLFMWSIIAASVVDFPDPVVPVSRTMPRSSSASSVTTGGSESSSIVEILFGIARHASEITPRCWNALTR